MYWMTVGIFLLGFLLIHRIVHSPFGMVLKSIRENEPRATSLGYRTDDYKPMASSSRPWPRRRGGRAEIHRLRYRDPDGRLLDHVGRGGSGCRSWAASAPSSGRSLAPP